MTDSNPSIISHVSLGTRDLPRALVFYDAVMATIGARRHEEIRNEDKELVAVAYGKQFPEFWIQVPDNKKPADVGNGIHVGFIASDKTCVHQFHEVALKQGGTDNGAPGPRPHYGEPYYGCFVLDLDGNRIEASFWDFSMAN
ncbi:MAG: VOC family protein [Granulosicoccus sp.]